jgi:hypothetical protein
LHAGYTIGRAASALALGIAGAQRHDFGCHDGAWQAESKRGSHHQRTKHKASRTHFLFTLDAIHIATMQYLRGRNAAVRGASDDERMSKAALALGIPLYKLP